MSLYGDDSIFIPGTVEEIILLDMFVVDVEMSKIDIAFVMKLLWVMLEDDSDKEYIPYDQEPFVLIYVIIK